MILSSLIRLRIIIAQMFIELSRLQYMLQIPLISTVHGTCIYANLSKVS